MSVPIINDKCWNYLVDTLERMTAAGYVMCLPDEETPLEEFDAEDVIRAHGMGIKLLEPDKLCAGL